jgi:integrase
MKNKPIAECIGAVLDFSKRFRSEDTITHYRRVCTQVQSYYNNCRETHFSFAVQQEIEKQASENLEKDSTCYYKNGSLLLRVLRMLQDFNEGIPFQEHYHREKRYKYKLQPFYQKLSEEFKESLTVSINTIPTIYSIARDFFHYLQESGISDMDNVSHDVIYAFMKEEYRSHQGSTPNVVYVLRRICVFFRKCGFIHVPTTIMPFSLSPPKNKVLPAFKTGDMERILSQPDTETSVGKRDYAVLVLASVTGMRAIDIANIRLLDFQWEDRAIHFIQHKTGNGVTLPLDSRAIYAVSDYILHGRPESSCPFVFLTKTQPYRKLSDKSSISNILNTYVRLSGIEKNPHDGKAFHAFRRSMGSWLLETYAAPELISQILGHKSTDVLKRYLPLSPSKLRTCALGLKGIPVKSEVYK